MPLLPEHSAPQHERAPRPLPLFLELVREVSERDPELARSALAGLRTYEQAPHRGRPAAKPEIARVAGASLRDHGGTGPPALLVPSLINPPRILDLDGEVSLTARDRADGPAGGAARLGQGRGAFDPVGHGAYRGAAAPLSPRAGQPVALIGYCLGGTMAIAAASLAEVERVVTIAAPWKFPRYPEGSKQALADMWRHSEAARKRSGRFPWKSSRPPSGRSTPSVPCASSPNSAARSGKRGGAPLRRTRGMGERGRAPALPCRDGADRRPVRPRPSRVRAVDRRRAVTMHSACRRSTSLPRTTASPRRRLLPPAKSPSHRAMSG